MPLGDINKLIDQALLNRRGMTSTDIENKTREDAYQNNQINQNLQSWTKPTDFMPFGPQIIPKAGSVGNMLTAKYGPELMRQAEDESISNSLGEILSTNAGLSIMKEKGGNLFGTFKPSYKFLKSLPESPDKLKNTEAIQSAVNSFKTKINAGDMSALAELKNTFQTMKNDFPEEEALTDLTAAYQNITNYAISRSNRSTATSNVSSFFTLTPEEQSSILQDVQKNKKQLPFFLQGKDGSFEATQNKLLDAASFDITSPVYNETDLKTWKLLNYSNAGETAAKNSAYYKKLGYSFDPTKGEYSSMALAQGYAGPAIEKFNAQKNLSYNFAVQEALHDQTVNLQNKSLELQTQIDKEVDKEKKDQLIIQKASVEKNLTTATQLLDNLEPYTNADKYLKTYYPLAYEKQKAINKSEVLRGESFAKTGEESTFKESTFRSYQGLNKIYTSTMAGVHHLIGDNQRGLSYDLASQDLTPPSYRSGIDFNKNKTFEQNELVLGKEGRPISFNDAMYEGKDGTNWNLWTAVEQTAPVAAQMAATIALSRATGMGARAIGLSYKNIGNAIGMESALVKAAPRISTFGNVFVTTFPSIYAEERKNYKNDADALAITTLRTSVESITETFIPQTELLKTGRSYGPLDPFFKKIADKLPFGLDVLSRKADVLLSLYPTGTLSKTKAALLMLPARLRKVVSEGVQEGLVEEEGSLLGNYFVDKYASTKNFEVPEANDLTLDNVITTGIGGFVPSLFVSGGVEMATNNAGKERLRQARWDLANNPSTYKDFITKQVQANKITPEQGHERMALVDNLNNTLESMTEMGNIKNLTTLLDDKEAQKNYFHSVLEQGDLLKIDRLALTPDQQKDYDALLARNADTIEKSKKNIEKYTNLTSPEKEQIVSNVFEERAKRLEDPNTSLSDVLTAADYARKQIAQFKKSDKNYDFVQSEYEKYHARAEATIADRVDNFQSLLENSPEQITNLELQLAQESFIPYLQRYNETKSEFVTPETEPSVEGPSEANLIQKIEQELANRQRLFEDDFNNQVPANLKNPETKDVQKRQLGLAELSAQELETGELAEGVHDHLDTATKLFLADALESHKEQKEQNPNQPTSIESSIDGIVKNEYELSTRGLSPEDALAKRISMNKGALGVNTTQAAPVTTATSTEITTTSPVTTSSFAPTPVEPVKKSTANTGFVEPTADAQDIIEYLGLDPENTLAINVVVFTQVSAENRQIDEIEEAEDRAPERVALFERVLTQSDPLDIYSGLLAMYPEQAKNIEQFFATYEDSPNTNLLSFLTKSQVEQLTEVLDEKLKPEEAPKETTSELDAKKAAIEKRKQEELDTTTSAGYGVIASDYLFTGGRGVLLSTDYLLQALVASFPFAGKQIDSIRNKYASKLGNISDDLNSESYKDAIAEIRNAINTTYQNSEIESLFDEILKNATGFISREGNRVSSRLEALNDEHQNKIEARYKEELDDLENQVEPIEEVPQSTFEDEVVDGIIRDQELLSQVEQVPVTPRDLSLNIVSLNSANVPLTDDPRIAFAVNVVNAFDNQREKLPVVKLRIQGAMETYRYVLSSAKFEALKTLKNKPTLTSEDVEMLKSILSLNGVPFHENSFIQYLIDNPSKIGTGVLSVLTDEEGKVMLFEKNGVISAVGTPLISTFKANVLKGSLKTLVDQIKANPETVATANITGTVPGTSLVPIKLSAVKNKPNYSLRVFTEPTPDASGKYTLYPGRTYIVNSNNFFKSATAVSLPKADGELVYKLVEAFNNGTLPNGLPQSTAEFLNYLRTYQLTSFKSEKAVYVLDKNKAGDKIVFKKKNIAGKWQSVSRITDKVKASIIESFNDAYKNILADKLNSNDRYYPTRLNANGEIELLPATTYRDHVMSPEFGATFNEEGNKTLGFDTPQINAPSSSQVTVSEVLENIPSQETPITESENTPTPVPTVQETPIEGKKVDGQVVKDKMQEIERQPVSINVTTDASGKMEQTSEEVVSQIKTELDKIGLPYSNVVANDKGSTYFVVTQDGQQHEILKLLKTGNALIKPTLTKAKWINHLIKTQPQDLYNFVTAKLETPSENIPEVTTEQPVRRRRSPKDLNNEITVDRTQLERSRLLENRINAKQKAKAKAWVASHPIFKNTSFIFDQTINHPEAYAVWSKSGIQLFSGANWAEAYHEAWHEFTQLYLTPEQKQALYKEAAKIYGNLTPFELEEKMAEDFRSFALSGGKVFPEAIRKSKEAKGIFQSIWDFITNLFSSKKTVDFYFKQLYKGNIASYNRSEDNIRFKELFSKKLSVNANGELVTYSFVESDKIVKQFDALFTHVANQITKSINGSFVNVAVSKEVIPKVYVGMRNIMSQTYNELLELEEAGDTSVTPKLDYLDNLLENFDTVAQFHIQNSLIFDNKVKKGLQLDNIEEQQDTQGELGSFDQSVNEISQKELASNLIISAIRTLPKHTKGNINPEVDYLFGVSQLGDFDTNWNILRRTLAGLTTYEQMYAKLQELSKEYPQFTALLNYLPQSIERFSALSFKNEFFNLFTMPYMEGYTTKITKDDNGGITVKVNKSSSLDAVRLKNLYDGEFGMTQGLYKVINPNTGLQDLDVDAYFTNNPSLPVGLDVLATDEERRARISQLINLIRPLGFNLSPEAVNSIPLEDMALVEKNVNFIRTKLRSLGENGTVGNPLNQLSSPHKVDKAVIKSENSAVNYFLNLEVKANPEYIDDMRMNAEGSRVWSVNQHTFMSRVASALNDYETYPTAKDVYKAFPQLDPEYNSNTIGSFVLDYLFDKDGNRITDSFNGGKAVYRQVELANLEGIKIEEEGEKTINTNYIDKHFAEVNSFLQQGVEEINRLSGKSTTRAFVLDLGLRKFLGMTNPASKDGQGNIRLFEPQMRLLFKAIMAEIKMTKEIEDKVANGQKVYVHPKVNIRDSEGNPKLGYFEDILTSEQRRKLYFLFENTQVINENGDNVLNELFEKATSEFPIIAEIAQDFNIYFAEQAKSSLALFKGKNLDTVEPVDLFKYHFFSFLNRLEQHKLFYGHPYYYKSAKDIEKRLSAWNAFGSYTMLDPANTKFLQDKVFTQRGSFINYAEANNIPVNEQINDLSKVNYIVLKDNPVVSKTALANKEAYGESLDAYINEGSEKDKSKTQDAAAFMTLDFFKRFYALSTGITPEMDQEIGRQNRIYQAILDNDQATLRKELNTKASYKFTIKKLQYAGFAKGVNNEGVPVFHKYSVKPILPSEAANNPELLAILHKLHASSADYAVFESGTKIAETVTPVSLFKGGKVDTTNVPIGQIDIKHLKEQVLIENKESFESVFSTQFRSLLYKDAEDAEVLKLYEAYKSYVKEIVEYDKLNYLENLNDKDKLVNFLLKELEKKNASEATKDLIKVKNDGTLMYMLDSMVDRTVMESAIVSSAKRKIIRQKLNGAQRVQYPVSVVRPGRTLNYYSLTKDGKQIVQAEVIVSFSKGYYPLLNLMYEGSPIGELDSNGEPIYPFDALTRLNEALKNPAFVKANKKALSMVAIRIPGQGYNSMENFTVVEFLPEESGEIILVPDEMVVKSGSDYDIDKLFCYDPYISQDGSVPLTTQTAQQSFDQKKKLEEEYKGYTTAINQTKEYKNELIAKLEEILTKNGLDKNKRLGEIYKELKELKSTNSSEVDEEAISIEDLKKLQEAFKTGTNSPVVKRSQELIDRIKTLSSVLSESFDQELSQELREVADTFKELYAGKQKIKNEIEGLRKTLANNLVFNVVDRLSQPDIFSSLITPNSSDIIKSLAAEFGEVRDNTTATYTSILSPIYQMYVFNLNTYKKSLGVGAKVNTFHSLVQKAKLNLENESANRFYILPSNKVDDKVYYSGIYDTNGDIISLLNGQMISAHVDIEKEDEVARIYFNNVITPVVLYTAIAGTPVKDITRLINQTYKNQPEDKKSQRSSIVRYGLGTSAQDILEEMRGNPEIAKFIKVGKMGINVKKTVGHALNLLTSKASKEAVTEFMLTEQTPLADFYRFMQFMEFEAQQKQLSTLSLNTDYHTFSPQNFESFRRGAEDLRQLRKENYFNRSAVDYMISETEISPFQIQADILDKFVEVMPISANRKLTDIVLTMHASLTKKGSKVDYEKFSRTFKNDLLYALFVNRVPEAQEYEQYLVKTNENNIVNMRNSLVSQLEKRGIESNNVIFDMFKQNTNSESAYIRTGLLLSSVDYSINVYKEAFEDGLSWSSPELNPESAEDAQLIEDMQKFFKVFAYAGILGTQLNKKIDSYLPLIPESIYTYSMSQVVNEFKNELDVVSANLLEEVRNTLSAKPSVTEEEDNIEDELTTKLLSNSSFLGQFINRFQEVHPEFNKIFKNVNPDLAFFKDYRLDQENSTPTKKKVVKENVPTPTTIVQEAVPVSEPVSAKEFDENQSYLRSIKQIVSKKGTPSKKEAELINQIKLNPKVFVSNPTQFPEGLLPSEIDLFVAENSDNIYELAISYLEASRQGIDFDSIEGTKDGIIYGYFRGNRVSTEDLADYIGKNISGTKDIKGFVRYVSKSALPIDIIAQELSTNNLIEITPQDIIDFILNNPEGPKQFLNSVNSEATEVMKLINERSLDLFGIPFSVEIANAITNNSGRYYQSATTTESIVANPFKEVEDSSKEQEDMCDLPPF